MEPDLTVSKEFFLFQDCWIGIKDICTCKFPKAWLPSKLKCHLTKIQYIQYIQIVEGIFWHVSLCSQCSSSSESRMKRWGLRSILSFLYNPTRQQKMEPSHGTIQSIFAQSKNLSWLSGLLSLRSNADAKFLEKLISNDSQPLHKIPTDPFITLALQSPSKSSLISWFCGSKFAKESVGAISQQKVFFQIW